MIRKLIPVLIFLSGAFLGKPLILETVGLAVKAILYFENGWRFTYESIDWHQGKLLFSNIHLIDPALSMHADGATLFWSAKHLEIEKPTLELDGIPRIEGDGSDWTLEIKEGILSSKGGQKAQFSFKKIWPHHLGSLVLKRENSQVELEALQEEKEIWVDAHLHHFDASEWKDWIDAKGVVNGKIHLVFENGVCQRGAAHLNVEEGGFGSLLSNVAGSIDWEGEVGDRWFANFVDSAKVRLKLLHADLKGTQGEIERIKGNFSLTAQMGAKWEFEGTALAQGEWFPISWSGKAFLHPLRARWVETEAFCRDARISLHGLEEKERFRWKGEGAAIDSKVATLLQSLAALVDPRIDRIRCEEGRIDLRGAYFGSEEWEFALETKDLKALYQASELRCQAAQLNWTSKEEGAFQFSKLHALGSFQTGRAILLEGWEGSGTIQNSALLHAHCRGAIQNQKIDVVASGTLGDFEVQAKGEEGEIALKCSFDETIAFEIEQGDFQGLEFAGTGMLHPDLSFFLHLHEFEGELAPLFKALAIPEQWQGRVESVGSGFQLEGSGASYDWSLQAKGELAKGFGFYCPWIEKKGELLHFDLRIETPTWDLVRLYGFSEGGICSFDPARTHFLGHPLQIDSCVCDAAGPVSIHFNAPLSWKTLIAAAPLWWEQAKEWISLPIDGETRCDVFYAREGGSTFSIETDQLSWKERPLSLKLSAVEEKGAWHLTASEKEGSTLSVQVEKEGAALRFTEGQFSSKAGIGADFFGHLDRNLDFEFHLPHLKIDLGQIAPFSIESLISLQGLDGVLEGKGIISRRSQIEADFDFAPCKLKAGSCDWENRGTIHLRFDSKSGLLCSGLDLETSQANTPLFGCKIALLQLDSAPSLWRLNQAAIRLPAQSLQPLKTHFPILSFLDGEEEIAFVADFEAPSDFSSLSCSIQEATIFCSGASRDVRDLHVTLDKDHASARFLLNHQGYPVKVSSQTQFGATLLGRLVLEDRNEIVEAEERPLSIDWIYSSENGLLIREIDGTFGGIDASFHPLDSGTSLIGSARLDFHKLSRIIPQRISQVFSDLQMGKGYELKGRLSIGNGLSFRGLFSGKQIDLFGFQLRTLLAQFEFDPGMIRLYDLKISDSAGMMKIDELLVSSSGNDPWTISIPHLTILELRPSLLQKEGKAPEPAGPLVVRELRLQDFKGLLEESKTYSAKGELFFINSFRREHTLFDIPSDLLGRIVGLDLELLIPACGHLSYELNNGLFHLTSLQHAFSEGRRSEFFLVPDPAPFMDLDGNLHILVSMKQFVLFKLTESFQILIDGKLNDPQFHLQKKRRFLGL